MYGEIKINDNYFEVSKTFIILIANLKIVLYYLSKNNYENAKIYFKKVFTKLINNNYIFRFELNINEPNDNMFSFIRDFIFNSPYFNPHLYANAIQINRNETTDNKMLIYNDIKGDKMFKMKNDKLPKFVDIKVSINDPEQLIDLIFENEQIKIYFSQEIIKTIEELTKYMYQKPYLIMFGRMNFNQNPKNDTTAPERINIDQHFHSAFNGE